MKNLKFWGCGSVIFTFGMKTYIKHDAIKIKTKAINAQMICALVARAVSMPAPQEVEITAGSLKKCLLYRMKFSTVMR